MKKKARGVGELYTYNILYHYIYCFFIFRSDNRNLVFLFTNPVDRRGEGRVTRQTVSLKDASRVIGPELPRSSLSCPAGAATATTTTTETANDKRSRASKKKKMYRLKVNGLAAATRPLAE